MREKLAKFMQGRYGADQLYRAQILAALVLVILSSLLRRNPNLNGLFSLAALAMLIWAGYRFFSKNVQKRYLENLHFMEKVGAVRNRSQMNKTKFDQRKDYKFFVCPNCKTNLRVPKAREIFTSPAANAAPDSGEKVNVRHSRTAKPSGCFSVILRKKMPDS